MKKNKSEPQNLDEYIAQLSKDIKPNLTYGDIDEKIKSGSFNRTVFSQIPKPIRIVLAFFVIGSIIFELISGLISSYEQMK